MQVIKRHLVRILFWWTLSIIQYQEKTKINFDLALNLFDLYLTNDSTSSISKFGHTSLFASSDVFHSFPKILQEY